MRSEEERWLSLARWSQASGLCGVCRTRWGGGGRWKSQNRKNVYLSPYVEEPLNSRVIKKKSLIPELRSRKCFCVSRFLCYIYTCIFHIGMLCPFHTWRFIMAMIQLYNLVSELEQGWRCQTALETPTLVFEFRAFLLLDWFPYDGLSLVWFGLVLWHISYYRLFNAKSIFIHIKSSISNNSVQYNFLYTHS